MSFLKGLFRSRDKPGNRLNGDTYSVFFGGTSSGATVTERSAMQMTAVYACVRILSESVAGLPLTCTKPEQTAVRSARTSIHFTACCITNQTTK